MTDLESTTAAPERTDRVRAAANWVRHGGLVRLIRGHGILLALFILLVVGAALSPHFLTPANAANVARQASIVGILGDRDDVRDPDRRDRPLRGVDPRPRGHHLRRDDGRAASPGRSPSARPCWSAAASGAINGLGITKGGLQPFIMTLGMLVIARGATLTYRGRQADPRRADSAADIAWIGSGDVVGIPVPFLLFIGIARAGLVHCCGSRRFGRQIYAVGDNPEAARLSGIPTERVIFSAYVISGLCAAVAALIVVVAAGRRRAEPGQGFELDAIAIVVIGGTSLFGGEGGVGGTVVGAAIVAGDEQPPEPARASRPSPSRS